MNHPACSAQDIETSASGAGPAVALCVAHLIAGVIAAFVAILIFAVLGGAS